jgi:hypothetical protein
MSISTPVLPSRLSDIWRGIARRPACLAGRVALLIMAGLPSLAGCGGGGPELAPVRGELYVGEEPAAGAMVILHPANGFQQGDWPGGLPHAKVDDDGSFQFSSPPLGEGVPLGEYKLTAIWEVPAPGSDPDDPEPERIDRLEGRWANPDSSEITVSVQLPETELARVVLE